MPELAQGMDGVQAMQENPRPECLEKEYMPSRIDLLRNHEINIQFFNIGCVVRIGCKTIAFNDVTEAMVELNMYIADPRESLKKWNKIFNANE